MVLKKQTIWLLTMLTLMVALSAYYLLSGGNQEISLSDNDPYATSKTPQEIGDEMGIDITTNQSFETGSENVLENIRLEREYYRSQMMEKFSLVAQNSKDNNEAAAASAKIDELELLEGSENLVEQLIKAQGYADAVVYTRDSKVNVIVRKDELQKEEAVALINLVAKNLNVPGINVIVNVIP